MKNIRFSKIGNVLISLAFMLFFASSATEANTTAERTRNLAAKALSEKVQTDLANPNASVVFEDINQYQVSNSQIGIKGSGICLLKSDVEQLPINFDVKINVKNFSVANIEYSFVNSSTSVETVATAAMEEAVTLDLLKSVAAEYKTDNVVIALDGLSKQKNAAGENFLSGTGEARIGDFEWRKIQVEAQMDDKGIIKSVAYKIQE